MPKRYLSRAPARVKALAVAPFMRAALSFLRAKPAKRPKLLAHFRLASSGALSEYFNTPQYAPRRRTETVLKSAQRGAIILLLGLVGFLGATQPARAATSSTYLNFQARLLNNAGAGVPDGNYNIDFKIYNADSTTGSVGTCSGACLWEETRKNSNAQGVQVVNGYFSVNLGSVTTFPAINWDQQLWLTMNIGGTSSGASPTWDGEMQNAGHSIQLTAIPYSFIAGQLASTSGAHRGTLSFGSVTNDPSITLPNASGTVCLQSSSSCGFVLGSGTAFLQGGNSFSATATLGTNDANGLNIITNTHTVASFSSTGAVVFENNSDSNTAFQVQTSTASDLFNVNTGDGYVINNGTADLSGNLIQNPGFESSGTTDGTGWYTPSGTQVITNSSANAHAGNYELQVSGNSSTHAVTTKYFAVHPGDTIYVEAYVKNSAGANGDAGIYLEFSDKDKGNATFSNADTGVPGTSYTLKTITTTVPSGKVYVRVAASVKATSTTGTFYFDDFYMKRGNEQAPVLLTNTSTTAFQVQNASSQTVFGVDTTNSKLFTTIPDSGTAIGFTFNTPSYTTSGAKLLSLQNNNAEKFYVDKDGKIVNQAGISAAGNITTSSGNISTGAGGQFQINGTQVSSADLSNNSDLAKLSGTGPQTFTGNNKFTGTVLVQNNNAAGFQVQHASNAVFTVDTSGDKIILGAASNITGSIQFQGSGGAGTLTLTGPTTPDVGNYTLSIPAITANANICTDNSICSGYESASAATASLAGKLNKNAVDTSTAAVTAVQGNLYAFTNSSSNIASGVLKLDNGSNTEAALYVTGTNDYASGKAYIVVNNTNGTPTGNLIDLQSNATDEFTVDASGNVYAAGNINIASGKQYQVNGTQISTSNLSDGATLAKLGANQTFTGNNTFSSASNSFTGDGSGLSNLNASNVATGTLNDGRLSSNVALLNRTGQSFTGDNTFAPTANNAGTTIKQTSGTATSGNVLDVQTVNGSSHFLQITNAAANEGNVTLQSVGATRDLTLGSGSGTIFLAAAANTLQHNNSSLTIDVDNGTDSTLTITNAQGGAVANLSVEGDIAVGASHVYKVGATSGASTTCAGNTFSQNEVSNGGIVTSLTCANAVTSVTTPTTAQANGASISGNALALSYADGSNPGIISTSAQTIAGLKTLNGGLIVSSSTGLTVNSGGSISQTTNGPVYQGGGDSSGGTNTGTGNTSSNSVFTAGRYTYIARADDSSTACTSAIGCELQVWDTTVPTSPKYIGGADASGSAANTGSSHVQFNSIYVSGRYAYVTQNNDTGICSATLGSAVGCEFKIFDISNPSAPNYIGGADASGQTNSGSAGTSGTDNLKSVFVSGRYVFVTSVGNSTACTASTSGSGAVGCELKIFDISNPSAPKYVGGDDSSTSTNSGTGSTTFSQVYVLSHYAYIARASNGSSSSCSTPANCELQDYDISNPASPTYVGGADGDGTTNGGTKANDFTSIYVSGRYAFAVQSSDSSAACSQTVGSAQGCEFKVYDISNPASPTYVGGADADGTTNGGSTGNVFSSVYVSGRYAYIAGVGTASTCSQNAGSARGCEIKIFDISNPASPTYVGGADTGGTTNGGSSNVDLSSIYISGRYVYATSVGNSTACSSAAGSAQGCELEVYDVTGQEATSVTANSLFAGTIQVQNAALFNDQVALNAGLTVGQSAEISGDLGVSGLVSLQPVSSLIAGQNGVNQTLTNASSTGGTVNGFNQTITVNNTSSATTTNGINIAITDATTLANSTSGVNTSITDNGASGAKTNKAVTGSAGGSNTSAVNYGGYFSISGGAASSSAVYASNGSTTGNILQLQDNTTDIMTVADNGLITLTPTSTTSVQGLTVNTNQESLGYLNTPYGGLGAYGNLLVRSEDFATTWTATNVTVTANDGASNPAPDGKTTADKLVSSASGTHTVTQTYSSAGNNTYTFSVWIKTNSSTQPIQLRIDSNGTPAIGIAASFTATTSWQRFSVSQTFTSGVSTITPTIVITNNNATVVAWGGQLVQASVPQVYVRTISSTVAASDGLINNGTALFIPSSDSTTTFQVQNASGTTLLGVDSTNSRIFSSIADGASAVGFALNTPSYTTSGAKLLNLQNNTVEKFSVDKDGNVNIASGANYKINGSQIASSNLSDTSNIALLNATQSFTGVNTFSNATTNINSSTVATNQSTITLFNATVTNVTAFGAGTTIDLGANSGTITLHNANTTLGNAAGSGTFKNNGATLYSTLALGDLATGSIGSAASTVDIYTSFSVAPTASGRAYTVPTPTASTAYGRTVYLSNIAASGNYFTIAGVRIPPGSTAGLIWSNTNGGDSWQFAGAGGASIENQNTSNQTADFRISGSGWATGFDGLPSSSLALGGTNATSVTIGGTTNTTSVSVQGTNSSSAFQVQNSIGSNAWIVDTTALNSNLTNSSFEGTSISTWTYSGAAGGSVARDTTQQYIGAASLKVITGTTAAAFDGVKGAIGTTLSTSTTYTISWYDKITSGTFTDVIARFSYDGTTGNQSSCTGINTQTVSTSGWTLHTCQFTTGSGGTAPTSSNAIFIVQNSNNGGTQRTFYIDAVQLESGSTGTAYKETGLNLNGVVASPTAFKNTNDSTTAFQIQQASGNKMFVVDTLNNRITLGTGSGSSATVLVLGIKTDSGDPSTCTSGGMYYNSNSNTFRVCINGTWTTMQSYSDVQTYTSGDNTWTKPSGVNTVQVILIGAGGGGGGGGARNGGQERNGGGGGGAGAYATQIFTATDVGSSAHAAVGSAGSSGAGAASSATAGSNGGAGGASCFSSGANCTGTVFVQAYGGGGGGGGNQAGTNGGGGGGGGGTAAVGGTGSNTSNTGATGGNPAGGAANANTAGGAGAGGGSANSNAGTAGNAGGAAEYGGAGGGGTAGGNAVSGNGGSSLHGGGGGGAGASTNSGNATGTGGAGGVSQSNTSGGGGAAGTSGSACGSGGAASNGGNGSGLIKAGSGGGGGGANGGGGAAGCNGGNGGAPGGGGGGGGSGSTSAGNGGTGGAGQIWVISW